MNLRGLAVIAFGHGASDLYSGLVPFTVFYVVTMQRLSPALQGVLIFVWYLTSSIVQPFFGAYSDRHGRWWFLPAGVGLSIVAISLCGSVSSFDALTLLIVLGGIGSAIMHPEAGKYAALLAGGRPASAISIFQIGGQAGYALGPLAAALLFAHGVASNALEVAIPGAIATAVLFALMPTVDRASDRPHHAARLVDAQVPVDRLGVVLLVASTALRNFVAAAFMTYLPNLLTQRGYSLVPAGEVVSWFLAVSMVGMFAGGFLADRIGALPVSVGSLVLAAPMLFGFCTTGGAASLGLLSLGSILLAMQNAPGVAMLQSMLPRNLGMALGLMNGAAFGIGSALVATIGLLVAHAGPLTALAQVSLVPLLAAFAFVLAGRRRAPAPLCI